MMMYLECLIKSLRLAWLKRIFGINNGAWKCYLFNLLERCGGPLFSHCNHDIKKHKKHNMSIYIPHISHMVSWWFTIL